MKNFQKYNLSKDILNTLNGMNFKIPTPIQEKAIPLILLGNDILGSAQTGTGKTAAFCIPMIEILMKSNKGSALILTPTRELAKQISDVIKILIGHKRELKSVSLIGGESMGKQLSELRKRPKIFIGTPGRINDHLKRGTLNLYDTNFLVLDETDRMLDMGFAVQIDKIIKYIPKKRQTLMFSATIPKDIVKLSSKYLNNPKHISIDNKNIIAKNIKQKIIELTIDEKYNELVNQLSKREGSVLIFVKTKYGSEKIAKRLSRDRLRTFALHGGLRQNKRNNIMDNFRNEKFRILVATDIASRGLDIPHIQHIINYDLPQLAEDFIHRIGRTARAGLHGEAISFITKNEIGKWRAIEKLINPLKKFDGYIKKNKKNNKNNSNKKRDFQKNSQKKLKKYSKPKKNFNRKNNFYIKKEQVDSRDHLNEVKIKKDNQNLIFRKRLNTDSGDEQSYKKRRPRKSFKKKSKFSGDEQSYKKRRPRKSFKKKSKFSGDEQSYKKRRPRKGFKKRFN